MARRDLLPSLWKRGREEEPFFSLQRGVNRLFDDFFKDFDIMPFAMEERGRIFSPSVDVKETDKEILVRAELPGMEEKDVEVNIYEDRLSIKGERKEEKEEKEGDYYLKESSYGSFQRVIPLPQEVATENAEATFKKGILNIKLMKTEESKGKGKKIPITTH